MSISPAGRNPYGPAKQWGLPSPISRRRIKGEKEIKNIVQHLDFAAAELRFLSGQPDFDPSSPYENRVQANG